MTKSELIREIEYRKRYLKNIIKKTDCKLWRTIDTPIYKAPPFEVLDGSDLAGMIEKTIELLDAAVVLLNSNEVGK